MLYLPFNNADQSYYIRMLLAIKETIKFRNAFSSGIKDSRRKDVSRKTSACKLQVINTEKK
jgi:hypothetical protein